MAAHSLWALVRNARLEFPKLLIRLVDLNAVSDYASVVDRLVATHGRWNREPSASLH